jgi:hypothetical protein
VHRMDLTQTWWFGFATKPNQTKQNIHIGTSKLEQSNIKRHNALVHSRAIYLTVEELEKTGCLHAMDTHRPSLLRF